MNYLLGSGYYHPNPDGDFFVRIWNETIIRYADPLPAQRMILAVGNSRPLAWGGLSSPVITTDGNLGHVGALLSGDKPHAFCGWSAAFCSLALIAYNAELDFIFLEQDCLACGPWVKRIYADMGDGDMVFGRKMESAPYMPCAQSLVLVRHSFIPEMVSSYLGMGTDNDVNNLPEMKFQHLEEKFGNRIRRLSFGCDRERPIPYDDDVFYAQKLTTEEIETLQAKGKI